MMIRESKNRTGAFESHNIDINLISIYLHTTLCHKHGEISL